MEDKITIIEGPPPTFEAVNTGWALGLNESHLLYTVGLTRLRTFNGHSLVERCHRAWRHKNTINLEYRDENGLENYSPILAARTLEVDEGQMLLLWVRQEIDIDELEAEEDNLLDDFDEEDPGEDPDLQDP
jgi:hypothetical protein